MIGAGILIFFLLQAGFTSWRLASLQFLLLPAALAGGLVVAAIDQAAVSMIALAGLLTVLAMAIRGGLLQIKQYQRLEEEGSATGPRAGRARFTAAAHPNSDELPRGRAGSSPTGWSMAASRALRS